jgi:predicted dehydrogenase
MIEKQAPARIAIVGCGEVTGTCHLPAALASHKVHLQALVDSRL